MKNMNKILTVSMIAMFAVSAANAKIVSETMLSSTAGKYSASSTVESAIADAKAAGTAAQTTANAAVPKTTTVNGKALSGNISLSASDVGAVASSGQTASKAVITDGSGNVTTGTISAGMLATDAVETAKIKAKNVTAPKIADNVVKGSGIVTVTRDTDSNFVVSASHQDISGKQDKSAMVTATTGTDLEGVRTDATKYPSMATLNAIKLEVTNEIGGVSADKQNMLDSAGTDANVVMSGNGVVKSVVADQGDVTITRSTVDTAEITNGAVTADKLATDSVTTAKIVAKNVTAPKIADGVVTNGNGNVTVARDSTTSAFKISVADASTSAKGVVQLADSTAISSGTTGRVVDAAQLKVVADAAAAKQSPATTLAGYGITDAYTKTQADAAFDAKGAATTAKNSITASGSNGVSAGASNGAITVSGVAATNAAAGVIKIATDTEATTGTSETVAVNPKQLASAAATAVSGKADKANLSSGATKTKITYNAQGIVTAGADLAKTDIPSDLISGTAPISASRNATTGAVTISAADATTSSKGVVQVGSNINVSSGTISVPSAGTSTAGVMKLQTTTGSGTDGTMTQKAITDALDAKQDNLPSYPTVATIPDPDGVYVLTAKKENNVVSYAWEDIGR